MPTNLYLRNKLSYALFMTEDLTAPFTENTRGDVPHKQTAKTMPDGSFRISVNKSEPPPPREFITDFVTVAKSPKAKQIGTIQNMERFTAPLNNSAETNIDLPIKANGTDVIIPSEFEQFLPEIEEMIYQCSLNADNGSVYMLTVRQGTTKAGKNGSGYTDVHKDLNLNRINDGGAPNSLVMVASSTLTTGFSSLELSENAITAIKHSDNPNETIDKIIADSDLNMYSFPDGSITAHDANVIHALATPEEDTERTAILIAVHPEGEAIQALDANPALVEEIKNINKPQPLKTSEDPNQPTSP